MSFQLYYLPSYERCVKHLGQRERHIAKLVVLALLSYFSSGKPISGSPFIFEYEQRSYRLIFKKLRDLIWEAYIEGKVRVLTRLEKDIHYLVFAGNHDQVRQFLISF